MREGLFIKLKQNYISGDLLSVLAKFLKDIKQRVVLNGQNSICAETETAAHRSFILGPLFFLIYTNDYQKIQMQNYLLMMLHCCLLLKIQICLQKIWMMIQLKSVIGLCNGKLVLTYEKSTRSNFKKEKNQKNWKIKSSSSFFQSKLGHPNNSPNTFRDSSRLTTWL